MPAPQTRTPPWLTVARPVVAVLLGALLAVALGAATAMAGRVLRIAGFYEVFAALVLSVASVTVAHLLRWRPGAGAWAVALTCALGWLAADRWTDAWGFRAEQAQAVLREAHDLAEDFVMSGADTPEELVDLGLGAETGARGIRGALLVDWQSGWLMLRAGGLERRLPHVPLVQALLLAATVAFLTVLIRRALGHLALEPHCTVCGRYLTRSALGRVPQDDVARLTAAWASGERVEPAVHAGADGPVALRESCPSGHTRAPGWALVQLRSRSLGSGAAGLVARCPASAGQDITR